MIDILLTTHNGEKYLSEQIESLLNQSFTDWQLIIRDDGSIDDTVVIIQKYKRNFSEKIKVINDDLGNVGLCKSFSLLLEYSEADYIAFCDQDDVWLENKLEIQMLKMIETENQYGTNFPLLVHTDLIVADESMKEISKSFWNYQNINPDKMNTLNVLLLQNFVTGCASLINRPLRDAAVPISSEAIVHDWWVALVAIIFGKVITINKPTLLYRQHACNDTGAKKWCMEYVIKRIMSDRKIIHESLNKTMRQGMCLMNLKNVDDKKRVIINEYIELWDQGFVEKRLNLFRSKFKKYGVIRTIGLYLFI